MAIGVGAIILIAIGGGFIGIIGGIFAVAIVSKIVAIKLKKEAIKFMNGKRENKYKMDNGKIMNVNKFVLKDNKGKETKIGIGKDSNN
jgi:hypothetical protein